MARPKKGTKSIDGSWVFSDFSKGLYLLNTPRNIGEQLYSLAMVSGRNCWSEKGALVSQNGYLLKDRIPEEDIITGYSRTTDGMNNIFITTQSGSVYLYTASEGLKEYKTKSSPSSGIIMCRRGKDLIYRVGNSNYLFGGYYDGSSSTHILDAVFTVEGDGYKANIPLEMMKYFWSSKDLEIDGKHLIVLTCVQELGATTATLKVYPAVDGETISTGTSISVQERCSLPINFVFEKENIEPDVAGINSLEDYVSKYGYAKDSPEFATKGADYIALIYGAKLITPLGEITTKSSLSVKATKTPAYMLLKSSADGSAVTGIECSRLFFGNSKPTAAEGEVVGWYSHALKSWTVVEPTTSTSLSEFYVSPIAYYTMSGGKVDTIETNQFVTTKEEPIDTNTTINPILMEVSQNRLFLLDSTGRIYYSQIGVVDGFKESSGAGYFEGFYNDYSQCLAIEDFLSGTLIVKQGGFYYLTISSSSTATGSAIFTVNIQKISNAGQEYASDHVIVGEKVFAYDTNTGAIVNAVATNVFGSLVSGKPIISSEYLNARSLGLNGVKRSLTYNAESEVFILYYGENLSNGLVLTNIGTLFPRQLDQEVSGYVGFNQGVLGIGKFGNIFQDFIKGTIVPNIKPEVEFEAIGLRDNRLICSSILEITELNGIDYEVTTRNAGSSYNIVSPTINEGSINLPPFLYSDFTSGRIYDSYSLDTQWAVLKSNVTRLACPMSGREGVSISMAFPANTAFCLSALRLPDFSQGE